MGLREELLSNSEKVSQLQEENYQLNIENEDLRDRLQLVTGDKQYSIEYQAYLPFLDLEKIVSQCDNS